MNGDRICSQSGRDQGLSRREGTEFRCKRDRKVHDEYKKRSLESDSLRDARYERGYL